MNDQGLVCIAGFVTILYSVYITAHVLAGSLIPDGLILSGCVGALCVLAGVKYQKNVYAKYEPAEESTEYQE